MGYSKAQIYNIALNMLGVSASVQNVNQPDTRTIVLNNFYTVAKEQVLKDFDWNFANTFRELTPTDSPCNNPKFQYEYDYPNDCISAREIIDENGKSVKFNTGSNSSAKTVIYANISPAILRYTRRVEKEIFFSPEFVMTLATYLSALTGESITGSSQKSNNNLKKYQMLLAQAKINNATEGSNVNEDENITYIDER